MKYSSTVTSHEACLPTAISSETETTLLDIRTALEDFERDCRALLESRSTQRHPVSTHHGQQHITTDSDSNMAHINTSSSNNDRQHLLQPDAVRIQIPPQRPSRHSMPAKINDVTNTVQSDAPQNEVSRRRQTFDFVLSCIGGDPNATHSSIQTLADTEVHNQAHNSPVSYPLNWISNPLYVKAKADREPHKTPQLLELTDDRLLKDDKLAEDVNDWRYNPFYSQPMSTGAGGSLSVHNAVHGTDLAGFHQHVEGKRRREEGKLID